MLYEQQSISLLANCNESAPSGEDLRNRVLAIIGADQRSEVVRSAATAAFLTELRKGPCDLRTAMTLHGVTVPDGINPSCLGAVTGALSRRKVIVRTGAVVAATQKQAHARPLAVWQLAEEVCL